MAVQLELPGRSEERFACAQMQACGELMAQIAESAKIRIRHVMEEAQI
jgi:hypothetical protein